MKGIGIPVESTDEDGTITGVVFLIDFDADLEELVLQDSDTIIAVTGLLTPAIVTQYLFARAFVAGAGGWSSHGVALARAHGIPCLVGVGNCIQALGTGSRVRIDIFEGVMTLVDQ